MVMRRLMLRRNRLRNCHFLKKIGRDFSSSFHTPLIRFSRRNHCCTKLLSHQSLFTTFFKFLSRSTGAGVISSYFSCHFDENPPYYEGNYYILCPENISKDFRVATSLKQIQLPIARPPWKKQGRKLESMCRKALFEFDLLQGVDKLAIALSGGKDSLTLLFLLKAILGKGLPNIPLYAINVDGEFSCGAGISQGYLKGICHELDVPLIQCHSTQKKETLECYSCSRERRKLIFDAAKEVGATTIAFGHHRDDSIQTLMMNLLHKAEFAAILPKIKMHHFGVTIIRPLIYIPQNVIKEFACSYGFARITCQCPVGQESMRRKTEDLLLHIEEIFPNVRENLAQASMGGHLSSKKALMKSEL